MWKYMESLARLAGEDRAGSQAVARAALNQFGDNSNPDVESALCATAGLQPIPTDEQARWVEIAERLLGHGERMFHRRNAAGVLLRCGQAQRAREILLKCYKEVEENSDLTQSKIGVCLRLALANLELNNIEEAKRWLAKAERAFQDVELTPFALMWNIPVFYELTRSEITDRLKEDASQNAEE